ncbi:MAG TPA: hypothetical protein VH598_09815, partial [Verrucomicrobiae bacterium]|nr:hypothetical protein [Verrucomicrobiae bacterium]
QLALDPAVRNNDEDGDHAVAEGFQPGFLHETSVAKPGGTVCLNPNPAEARSSISSENRDCAGWRAVVNSVYVSTGTIHVERCIVPVWRVL